MRSLQPLADQVPGQSCSPGDRLCGGPAEYIGQVFGRQAESRADRADIGGRESLARGDVGDGIERPAKPEIGGVAFLGPIANSADCRRSITAGGAKRGELGWLEREGAVRAAIVTPKGYVLLDDCGAKCNRGNRDANAEGMIGKSDDRSESVAQMAYGQKNSRLPPVSDSH